MTSRFLTGFGQLPVNVQDKSSEQNNAGQRALRVRLRFPSQIIFVTNECTCLHMSVQHT